jgi:hypothetical protein
MLLECLSSLGSDYEDHCLIEYYAVCLGRTFVTSSLDARPLIRPNLFPRDSPPPLFPKELLFPLTQRETKPLKAKFPSLDLSVSPCSYWFA